jgi:hypothetical protein
MAIRASCIPAVIEWMLVVVQVFAAEGAAAAARQQEPLGGAEVVPGEPALGQGRQLEEEHVPAPADLSERCLQLELHHARVRDVENGRSPEPFGMEGDEPPGDGGPEVVARDEGLAHPQLIQDADDVFREAFEAVVGDVGGFVAQVVSPLIRSDHAVAGGGKRWHLAAPALPVLGEPMEQDDDGATRGAVGHGVQPDSPGLETQLLAHSCSHESLLAARGRRRTRSPPARRPRIGAQAGEGTQARSKRSAFITFVQAATKSFTNFSLPSSWA